MDRTSKELRAKLLKVNTLGVEVEMTLEEAEMLGAVEETALSEEDAKESCSPHTRG